MTPRTGAVLPWYRRFGSRLLDIYAAMVLLYLFLPIFVIILYSFNRPEGKFNFVWKAFSLDAWRDPFKYQPLFDALKLSLKVAALSTSVATVFGAHALEERVLPDNTRRRHGVAVDRRLLIGRQLRRTR